jgi:hypothetical protein
VCRRERGLPLSATSACGGALAGDALSVHASCDNKKTVVRLLQRILQRAKFREASPSARKPLISNSPVALFERAARPASIRLHLCSTQKRLASVSKTSLHQSSFSLWAPLTRSCRGELCHRSSPFFALSKKDRMRIHRMIVLTSPFSKDVAFDPPTDDNELFVSRELRGTQVRRSGVNGQRQRRACPDSWTIERPLGSRLIIAVSQRSPIMSGLGTKQTCSMRRPMSVIGSKADMARTCQYVR